MEVKGFVCRATKAAESYIPVILHKDQDHGEGGPVAWLGGGIGGEGCAKAWQ